MRFKLDAESAKWFRLVFMKPSALAKLDEAFVQKLYSAWRVRENVLNLTPFLDDKEFLTKLIELLWSVSYDTVYTEVFRDLGKRVASMADMSIIDRLAAIYEPPKPTQITSKMRAAKEAAMKKILDRRGLGPPAGP